MKKNLTIFAIVFLSIIIVKSQNPYWRPAGNAGVGLDMVNLIHQVKDDRGLVKI